MTDNFLEVLRSAGKRAAVVTDFDGTLSSIVDDPAAAGPVDGVVDALHELANRYGMVAVVSGRPVTFLRDRLEIEHRPPSSLVLSGLYGLEWSDRTGERTEPEALPYRDVVAGVAERAEAEAPEGVGVERKGLSVTLHVRTARQADDWARRWAEEAAASTGLALHAGRMSYELRPPVRFDKGTVVDSLIASADAACFLGDDLGDLPAFDALDRLRDRSGAATLRIGVRSAEAPAELLDRADLVVDGPEGSLALLRSLC